MKSNEQISDMIRERKFDSVRYASIDRLTINRIEAQSWLFLGQAMVGLKRGKMASLCFERSILLDPFSTWVQQAWAAADNAGNGRDDKQVLKLLEITSVTVTACILTRDSSRTIRQCIEALQGAVDEIIIVDTGSTDGTVEIVESFSIPVHRFEWVDDFSMARNYAQSLATCDWVIAIDSDEILFGRDIETIRRVAAVYHSTKELTVVRTVIVNRAKQTEYNSYPTRMFPRDSGVYWSGRIHEFVDSVHAHVARTAAIRFHHDGYDLTQEKQGAKLERNISILRSSVDEEPNNYRHRFYLGRELIAQGKLQEAEFQLQIALDMSRDIPSAEHRSEIHTKYVDVLVKTEQNKIAHDEAIQMTLLYPQFPDGWGWLAILENSRKHASQYEEMIRSYRASFIRHEDLERRLRAASLL